MDNKFVGKLMKTPANSYEIIHSGASGSDELLLQRYESAIKNVSSKN